MALKPYKRTTPSQRHLVIVNRSGLHSGKPVKGLVEGQTSTGGRNNLGRITSRFRGGGHKQRYRIVDFRRDKVGGPAKVAAIKYDPNRPPPTPPLHTPAGKNRNTPRPHGLPVRQSRLPG